MHAKRRALRVVNDKVAFQKLFGDLSERYSERKGGYTRIIKMGFRRGDDAPMALIELVDREEEAPQPKAAPKRKKRKRKPNLTAKKKPKSPKRKRPRKMRTLKKKGSG